MFSFVCLFSLTQNTSFKLLFAGEDDVDFTRLMGSFPHISTGKLEEPDQQKRFGCIVGFDMGGDVPGRDSVGDDTLPHVPSPLMTTAGMIQSFALWKV